MKTSNKLFLAARAFLVASLCAAPRASETTQSETVVAIKNVNVIGTTPGQKKLSRKRTMIVEGGIIAEVGKARKVEIPANATVIDGRKKYLLPGLTDMHVHMRLRELGFPFKPTSLETT